MYVYDDKLLIRFFWMKVIVKRPTFNQLANYPKTISIFFLQKYNNQQVLWVTNHLGQF